MRLSRRPRLRPAFALAFVLPAALTLGACGGGDDSSSTTGEGAGGSSVAGSGGKGGASGKGGSGAQGGSGGSGAQGGSGGTAGAQGGSSGSAGKGGSSGQAGSGGAAGKAGGGQAGAGQGGSSGQQQGGSGGTAQGGSAGKAGASGSAAAGQAGSSGQQQGGSGGSGGSGGTAQGGSAGQGQGGSGGTGPCQSSSECNGGVCFNGLCCSSAQATCGKGCCEGADKACLFGECVTPGKPCHTSTECGEGSYCEIALGGGSGGSGGAAGAAGASGAGGMLCTQPVPLGGKCLPLPPVCDQNGQPAGCVPQCEYKPPVGQLDAVAKWKWGTNVAHRPAYIDVWSTPTVGRVYDGNCDGKLDELDAPSVVFVSGKGVDASTGLGTCCQCTNTTPTSCHTGVLRAVDGATGQEIWSLDKANSTSAGFAGMSVALGDIDGDGRADIVAATGEGYVALVDGSGKVLRVSDKPIPGNAAAAFGWGGGLAIADMDGDGLPEIAFGATVFSTKNNAITLLWSGTSGDGGGAVSQSLSTFVDLDGAPGGHLELLAGRTAYKADGTMLWDRTDLTDGFSGVGDFDGDGLPEVLLVAKGQLWVLEGATGKTELGPIALPGTGSGGPPTIADFDGDGKPEIGVAMATFYSVIKPDYAGKKLDVLWKTPNHDLSSSVTGSSVFDFEGDGKAEVIYNDECFLWVFDGQTGAVRFAAPTSSFTGTEASVVADVDGDGHAEILMISNGADPKQWGCLNANDQPTTVNGVTWTKGPATGGGYRGLTAFGDAASSWVGTRTLWNQHTYHVSNVCDDRDSACDAPNVYGSIPKTEKKNWAQPWLNNFRQNVQDKGIFNAPDPVVNLEPTCTQPITLKVSVKNNGLATLPAGVQVDLYLAPDTLIDSITTTQPLAPGQTQEIDYKSTLTDTTASFQAKIYIDPKSPTFHQCNDKNDASPVVSPSCIKP